MASGSKSGASGKTGKAKPGRATTPTSGRYTQRTPKSAKVSPRWYAPVFLGLLVLGILVILLNYLSVFGTPSGWGLLIGLVIIATGFAMATRYR